MLIAPPVEVATLSLNSLLSTIKFPAATWIAAPPPEVPVLVALFSLNNESLTLTVDDSEFMYIAPPELAELLVNVVSSIVSEPPLIKWIAPPWLLKQSLIMESLMVRLVSAFDTIIAPPLSDLPLTKVTPSKTTFALYTSNILARFAALMVYPLPFMVMSLSTNTPSAYSESYSES